VTTVLLKVRVPTRGEGQAPVASVDLTYRDLVTDADGRCGGKLGAEVVANAAQASDLDSVVSGRLQRSETSTALKEANSLFEKGKIEEARRRLDTQQRALKAAAQEARRGAPATKAKDVARDFESQIAAVDSANSDFNSPFATPPPAAGGAFATAAPAAAAPPAAPQQTREGKSAVRQNQKRAVDMAF
jgi:Ca-activated chloride channel homolog